MQRCIFALLVFLAAAIAAAQEAETKPATEPSGGNATTAAEFAANEAQRYDIRYADERGEQFELLQQPLLRWSNPTRGEVYGSVVLWTHDGCPEAAASIYQFFDREQINIELVSLSESPLNAVRNGRLRWSPEAGVTFASLPDGPPPAQTPERRQLQMRSLARKFTGALADRDNDENFSQLRLMARPLHAYENSDGSRDGAVFALVNTTDPEILLIIESRETAGGREWMYAAARMHFCRLQLKLGDKVVWDAPQAAPPWDKLRGPSGDYVILEWKTKEHAAAD